MTPARPSFLAIRLLRALLPRDEVDAVLGDLSEDSDRHAARGRLWLELQAWKYVLAVAPAAAARAARTAGHILRDAVRALRAAPRTTAGILVILTVSIAAATVTFSVVDTVVLRPLPFENDHELVTIEAREPASPSPIRFFSPTQYLALRDRLTTVRDLAAVSVGRLHTQSIATAAEPMPVVTAEVTANLFDILQVRPIAGRTFDESHEVEGNNNVAVIGYGVWQRLFGGAQDVVGRTLQLTGTAVMGGRTVTTSLTVLGVAPRGFTYPLARSPAVEVWTPYPLSQARAGVEGVSLSMQLLGRRRSDAPLARVHAEVDAAGAVVAATGPERYRSYRFGAVPLKDTLLDPNVQGWMILVLVAVGVVMLVACANVANLQLARAAARTRELSIRAALGATRRQLVLSLLTESLLLSLVAAALAILVSVWGMETARAALPANLLRVGDIGLDRRVLIGVISAALATALAFGVMPAWHASRSNLVGLMKEAASGAGPKRWRAAFLVAEIAFVSVLLVSSTLIISSFVRVTTAYLGFDRAGVLEVRGPAMRSSTPTAAMERLRGLSGVEAVGIVGNGSPPLVMAGFPGGGASATGLQAAGAPADRKPIVAEFRQVSSGYFDVIRNPVIRGRSFDDSDMVRDTTIVIDERVAELLFGDRDPIGAEVVSAGERVGRRTVIGVTRHVRLSGPELPSRPQVYLPASQAGYVFLVRTSGRTDSVVAAIQAAFVPGVPTGPGAPIEIRRLEDAFRNITASRRFNATLMSLFGALAVVIGAAGVYGVMASVVAQQTRELGIRVALGATMGRIVGGVLAQAGGYLVVGLALGLPAAWWASQSIASLLFEVRPTDAGTYAVVIVVMAVTALVAAWIPARRAARVDPLISLRAE